MKQTPLKRKTGLRRTGPPRSNGRRKPQATISPASQEQRAKVLRMGFCIVCGKGQSAYRAIDPAHVVDRSLGGCDHEDCVVPLCRTFDGGCHRAFDEGGLDLLPYLEPRFRREQAHAVEHLGLVEVLRRVTNDRGAEGRLREGPSERFVVEGRAGSRLAREAG